MENEIQAIQEQRTGMDENEMMTELVKNLRKQLFHARLRTLASIVIAAGIIIFLIMAVPAILKTTAQANDIMAKASETITLANAAIESVTEMSTSITSMGENMDTFITENAESVATVMEKIEAVDFEGLNSAIEDLGAVIEPLAKFFNLF